MNPIDKALKKVFNRIGPQNWNEDIEDWDFSRGNNKGKYTHDRDAHAKMDAILAEQQAQKAQIQGILDGTSPARTLTEVTGSLRERETIIESLVITSTDNQDFNITIDADVVGFLITNSHNTSINVRLLSDSPLSVMKDFETETNLFDGTTIPASDIFSSYLVDDSTPKWEKLNSSPISKVIFRVKATSVPTNGSTTVIMLKRKKGVS